MARNGVQEQQPRGPDTSYDPYENRQTENPLSDSAALANLVKSAVGTGLFAMPNAFASVGLVIGNIGTVLMGLLITVSLHILIRIHDKTCVLVKEPILNYDQVVVASLVTSVQKPWLSTRVATYFVDVTILVCYIGVGAVYVIFIAGTVQECVDSGRQIDQRYYILMLVPLFCLINMMKYLSQIAILSILGNLFLFVAATLGMVYALKDGIGTDWAEFTSDVSLYPKFIGTAFFSMCSPGLIVAIQHDMKEPRNYTKYNGVLNQGMIGIIFVHAFVGSIGYMKWGDGALGNFIRNHPDNDATKITALVLQTISIYFTYGLQCYMPINIIFNHYVVPALEAKVCKGSPFLWDVSVRVIISLITALLALLIPKVDLFIGLVGAVSTSTLSTLIPVSLYILVERDDYGKFRWKLIYGAFLLTTAVIITLCAVIVSIRLIIEFFLTTNVGGA